MIIVVPICMSAIRFAGRYRWLDGGKDLTSTTSRLPTRFPGMGGASQLANL